MHARSCVCVYVAPVTPLKEIGVLPNHDYYTNLFYPIFSSSLCFSHSNRIESPRESNFTFSFSKKKEERRELLFENFSRSVKLHIYKNNKERKREIELRVKREKNNEIDEDEKILVVVTFAPLPI